MDMEEVWKPIKGYEGFYEVSSYWRVRSIDRYDRRGIFYKGRILKLRKSEMYNGPIVRLSRDGVQKDKCLGYIVADAFRDSENLQEIMANMPD